MVLARGPRESELGDVAGFAREIAMNPHSGDVEFLREGSALRFGERLGDTTGEDYRDDVIAEAPDLIADRMEKSTLGQLSEDVMRYEADKMPTAMRAPEDVYPARVHMHVNGERGEVIGRRTDNFGFIIDKTGIEVLLIKPGEYEEGDVVEAVRLAEVPSQRPNGEHLNNGPAVVSYDLATEMSRHALAEFYAQALPEEHHYAPGYEPSA
jgi:hypothetical protein